VRPRSITGPLILIAIGVLFLLNNVWHDIPFWSMLSDYWPILLIVIGLVGLVEVLYHVSRGVTPPPRPLAGGGVFWILVFVLFFAWGSRHRIQIGSLGPGGVSILGSDYEYDVSAGAASGGITRVVLDNIHGNLSLKGEDGGDVKVTGRKNIRAFDRSDAERANQQSQIRIERQGDLLVVRAEEPSGLRMLSISTDLDITVPRSLNVEARGRTGDLTIEDIQGSVDVTNGRGDVRLNGIGKDVKIESSRSGLVRVSNLKGNLDLEGRGGDVQAEDIQGQVTINGDYSGTLEFRALAKPLHFQSSRSELRAEQIPGSITLDLSELKMTDVVGPVRFQGQNRDVQATDVTNSLEMTLDRGDVQVTETKMSLPKMEMHLRNGDITLTLPERAAFELDGRTGQGEVENEFGGPLTVQSEGRAATIKGRTGAGPQLTLDTDRGTINLRKD
jgi:DUF4097 and DUF4098 domain-containing protein YvlB